MTQDRPEVARVFTKSGDYRGTAFFVAPCAAVTCWHVVDGVPLDQVRLAGPWSASERVAVRDIRRHRSADIAVLTVAEPNSVAHVLDIRTAWPMRGDAMLLLGCSDAFGELQRRPFQIAAYDSVLKMFAMQNLAAGGISGGPALDTAGAVAGVACLISTANLTYFIPMADIAPFLRENGAITLASGLYVAATFANDDLRPGLSSKIGSIHVHIDGGDDRDIAEDVARGLDPDWSRSEIATILEVAKGPQRARRRRLYDVHTPTKDGNESLQFFSTTSLFDGPRDPGPAEIAQVEDQVRLVLGDIATRLRGSGEHAGNIVVEAERVVGVVDADNTTEWAATPSLPDAFGPAFTFRNIGSASNPVYEIHFAVDIGRGETDRPPIDLATLLDVSGRAGIEVGGWFLFAKPDKWAFRSNMFLQRITSSMAEDYRRRLLQQLTHLDGLNLTDVSVRVIVEESLGVWKTPFAKLDDDALTVPELAAWENSVPGDSEFWVVIGNFLGDQNKAVEDAMLQNLGREVRYVYFLQSFADLSRWIRFRQRLQRRLGGDMLRHKMQAFVIEFEEAKTWAEELDCFLTIPRNGQPSGYKLTRDPLTNGIVKGVPLVLDQVARIRDLLEHPMREGAITASRRLTAETSFDGAVIWLDFGFVSGQGAATVAADHLVRFLDGYDEAISGHVSKAGGEVIRSNEAGYVVLLTQNQSDEEGAETVARALPLARVMVTLMTECAAAEQLPAHQFRLVLGYGKLRRTIRSHGRVLDGDTARDCRMRAAMLPASSIVALAAVRQVLQQARSPLLAQLSADPAGEGYKLALS
jgi:hypothetical protein